MRLDLWVQVQRMWIILLNKWNFQVVVVGFQSIALSEHCISKNFSLHISVTALILRVNWPKVSWRSIFCCVSCMVLCGNDDLLTRSSFLILWNALFNFYYVKPFIDNGNILNGKINQESAPLEVLLMFLVFLGLIRIRKKVYKFFFVPVSDKYHLIYHIKKKK